MEHSEVGGMMMLASSASFIFLNLMPIIANGLMNERGCVRVYRHNL